MPLTGEYEPSQNDRTREQVELYEATNGAKGGTLNGKPVVVLTFKGAKSGKLRKTPLMRIEHGGTYAVVASNAGAPTHPFWYYNIVANPTVELQGWGGQARDAGARSLRQRKGRVVEASGRGLFGVPRLSRPSGP
jgi:F420H(2)-dependent quinone reductase